MITAIARQVVEVMIKTPDIEEKPLYVQQCGLFVVAFITCFPIDNKPLPDERYRLSIQTDRVCGGIQLVKAPIFYRYAE